MNILVSGATGDIGYELIKNLTDHKCIAMGKTNKIRLQKISDMNHVVKVIDCDISSYEDIKKYLSEYDIDIYIHLVGISYIGLIQEMAVKDWDRIVAVNLSSLFYITKIILPYMIKKKKGKIIAVSSIWGKVGASMEVAYSATKGGIDSYIKALAKEVAPSNISCNTINLGYVDTKMNSHLTDEEKNAIFEDIPMGRSASLKECSDFIIKMIEMPNYLTGQNVGFDGGW